MQGQPAPVDHLAVGQRAEQPLGQRQLGRSVAASRAHTAPAASSFLRQGPAFMSGANRQHSGVNADWTRRSQNWKRIKAGFKAYLYGAKRTELTSRCVPLLLAASSAELGRLRVRATATSTRRWPPAR